MSNRLTDHLKTIPIDRKGNKPNNVTNAMALNAIRAMASDSYKLAIPELAPNTLINHNSVPYSAYSVHQNEFFDILVNKIGPTIIKALQFDNPLGVFRDPNFEYGETLEEIYIGLANKEAFNAKETNSPFMQRDTLIKVFYHDIADERKYVRTFEKAWTMKAFKNERSFDSFIDKMFTSLISSDELDEYENIKQLITDMLTPVTVPPSGTIITPNSQIDTTVTNWLMDFNVELVSRINNMSTPSRTRFENAAGVPNATRQDDLYLLCDSKLSAELDVILYANAFNMHKSTPLIKKIVVDEFPEYGGAGALNGATPRAALVSDKTIILKDKLVEMTNIYNPETLSYNYFLHHHQLISFSLIENAHIYWEKTA